MRLSEPPKDPNHRISINGDLQQSLFLEGLFHLPSHLKTSLLFWIERFTLPMHNCYNCTHSRNFLYLLVGCSSSIVKPVVDEKSGIDIQCLVTIDRWREEVSGVDGDGCKFVTLEVVSLPITCVNCLVFRRGKDEANYCSLCRRLL